MFSSNVVFEELVPRSFQEACMGFAFDKSLFHPWSVTEGEMRVLKCLGRLEVRADVKGGIFVASLAFI